MERVNKIGTFHHKPNVQGVKMSAERSMGITEKDMHRPVKETPKEEKYNIYGGAAGAVEIEALS